MPRLCDPDINMITLPGCNTPEPSIRDMIYQYYDRNGMGSQQSRLFTEQYIQAQDEICQESIKANLCPHHGEA